MVSHLLFWAWTLLLFGIQALPQHQSIPRQDDSTPAWNSCGNLIRQANAQANGIVNASDVYNCWATVPFNAAVATRFITYWNDTLQLHATVEWLKHPPAGYQKPAVDLIAGLEQIQGTINSGGYTNQYQFEADFQRLIYSAADAHVSMFGGILSSFQFANPYGITSLSLDGISLPKVYTTYDLYLNQSKGAQETWQPSAISQINGQDAIDYVSGFAALNSEGTLEPHSDWNAVMDSPALDIQYEYTNFQGYTTFYPGDSFSFTFENGTVLTDRWLAIYFNPGDTGPLETGGDFYNFFVLGFYPASYNPPNDTANATDTGPPPPTATNFANLSLAYPTNPAVYQANLTVTGFTTGYFYTDASLAVLSIPTFAYDDDDIRAFSDVVQQFITQAKAQGLQKVLIDLQQNAGGDTLLAYDVFKQFFPSITPYGGSDRRAVPLANTLGTTITGYCASLSQSDPDFITCDEDEWDAVPLLNAATGQTFTSWAQLFGPTSDGVDSMTLAQRLNIYDATYDYANLDETNPPATLLQTSGASPWAAGDIVILSDALCSSACALFLEMMRFDAGVKNVVVGGRPTDGPMQTPSGSRGARFYSTFELDVDVENAQSINSAVAVPNRNDQSLFINYAGISLRNQVGPSSEVPYQMQYQAADCRIFFTPNTFNNFTNLWHYAAAAMFTNTNYCVPGSTGHAPSNTGPSSAPAESVPAGVTYDPNGIVTVSGNTSAHIITNLGPQPDFVLPHANSRTPHVTDTVSGGTGLSGTQTQQTTPQNNKVVYTNQGTFTSESPGDVIPVKRRKRRGVPLERSAKRRIARRGLRT